METQETTTHAADLPALPPPVTLPTEGCAVEGPIASDVRLRLGEKSAPFATLSGASFARARTSGAFEAVAPPYRLRAVATDVKVYGDPCGAASLEPKEVDRAQLESEVPVAEVATPATRCKHAVPLVAEVDSVRKRVGAIDANGEFIAGAHDGEFTEVHPYGGVLKVQEGAKLLVRTIDLADCALSSGPADR